MARWLHCKVRPIGQALQGATAFADLDSGMVAHYANGLAIIKAAYGLTIRLRCRPACAAGKDCLDGIDFKLHMQLPASVFLQRAVLIRTIRYRSAN